MPPGWRPGGPGWIVLALCAVAALPTPVRADAPRLDGYASAASVAPGETLGVHVSTVFSSVSLHVVRFGADTAQVTVLPDLPAESYPVPDSAWVRGCAWPTLATLTVPAEWESGLYGIQLVPPNGSPPTWIPFVVRGDPAAPNPVLVLQAVNTYQAYNAYGGKSLYDFNSTDEVRAPRVTFDRPYDGRSGLGQPQFEQPFVRWFERAGFAADFATDVDLALDPALLAGRRLLVVVGHSEYWSRSMVDAVTAFVDTAGNLASFSGNTCFWAARYEDAGRTLVCYKSLADPMYPAQQESTTVRFRDRVLGLPESGLFGVMYPSCEEPAQDSLLFAHAWGWITDGLEDQVGQRLGRRDVGYEYDTVFSGFPNDVAVHLFETPVPSLGCSQTQVSTYYERQPQFGYAQEGGGVFAAGTIQWSWGLDGMSSGEDPDPRLQRLTNNLLRGLSQRLALADSAVVVVRAAFADAGPPESVAVSVVAAGIGRFAAVHDPVPLADDGAWPDSAAADGVWSGALALPAGERMPLLLAYHAGDDDLCTAVGHDWLWLSDTVHADSVDVRGIDTLRVCTSPVGVDPGVATPPALRAAPNPFRGDVQLAWDAFAGVRAVAVFDLRGRVVASLAPARGATAATWDGRGGDGRAAPPGVYWVRATTARGVRSLRVVKLR